MRLLSLLLAAALLVATPAVAQEDFVVIPDGGIYTLKATWDDSDYATVCFFNEDSAEELGCVSQPEPDPDPVHGQFCQIQITVMNPGADVNIRAFARDASNNQSNPSPNKATADFTPPTAPMIIE